MLFHFWFITITRRSMSLAIAASCLTFVALQVCLLPSCASCCCMRTRQKCFDRGQALSNPFGDIPRGHTRGHMVFKKRDIKRPPRK